MILFVDKINILTPKPPSNVENNFLHSNVIYVEHLLFCGLPLPLLFFPPVFTVIVHHRFSSLTLSLPILPRLTHLCVLSFQVWWSKCYLLTEILSYESVSTFESGPRRKYSVKSLSLENQTCYQVWSVLGDLGEVKMWDSYPSLPNNLQCYIALPWTISS